MTLINALIICIYIFRYKQSYINQFNKMSLNKINTFFKEYAKKGYLDKINPQLKGIAQKFYHEKQGCNKINSIKNEVNKQVACMQRMQQKMKWKLTKKKVELKYQKSVKTRFIDDIKRRQWLNQHKQNELRRSKQEANDFRSQSLQKLKYSKQSLMQSKRSLADLNRNQNQKIKEMRYIKRSQEWNDNRSRVSQIQEFKKQMKKSSNKFYQNKSNRSLRHYKRQINIFEKSREESESKIKELDVRLIQLKQFYSQTKVVEDSMSHKIDKLKKQTRMESVMFRSRLKLRQSSVSDNSLRGSKKLKSFRSEIK